MDGIVIQGSVGFCTFQCASCRQVRLEIRDSIDVVQAYLGQIMLVCERCVRAEHEKKESCSASG